MSQGYTLLVPILFDPNHAPYVSFIITLFASIAKFNLIRRGLREWIRVLVCAIGMYIYLPKITCEKVHTHVFV